MIWRDRQGGRPRRAEERYRQAAENADPTALHDLTPAELTKLVKARRDEGNASQSIAHELKDIRAATRHAAAGGFRAPEDMLNGTVKNAWRMPKLPTKTRYLTPEQYRQLLDHLDPGWGNKTSKERLVGCPDAVCKVLLRRLKGRRVG